MIYCFLSQPFCLKLLCNLSTLKNKIKLKKAPEANGVGKSEPPVLVPNGVVVLLNKGVDEGANKEGVEELKGEAWGVALDDPKKEDAGAEVVGVANRDDIEEVGAKDGVLKSENPLPEEVDEVAADVCGAVNAP